MAGYLNGDVSDDYVHTTSRFGSSTSLYADQVTQLDTTNGYISRLGYGARGSQTWMLDVTKTGVSIRNATFVGTQPPVSMQQGPVYFDVEAYANASDLNADGTFKNNVDASTAINLATAAIRAATTDPGGYGWTSGRVLRFNSPIYTINHTLDFTFLKASAIVVAALGAQANLYCGDSWAGPPTGSPGDGVITAAQSPMIDATGMAGCTISGISLCAQTLLTGSPAPTTKPAVGWLVGATESWSGAAWGGTNGDSGNNTFLGCSTIGWTKYADWAFVGSVITTLQACTGQSYTNESNSMSLYAGCTTLSTSGNPDAAGTAFDSVWYPNDGSPATSQKRLLRTEVGGTASELVLIRCEFHDMYPTVAASLGGSSDAQTNKQRTVLLHRINGFKMLDVPISCSGVAQIDLWGQCLNVDLEMTQNYNKGGSSARSNYFIRTMGVSDANPIKGLRWHNHLGGTAPQVGWIGAGSDAGNNAPCFFGLDVAGNVLGTAVPFFKTLGAYGGAAATVNLTNSVIDLSSCDVEFGGSIGPSVTFFNAGDSFQYSSSGGTDKSTKLGGETTGGILTNERIATTDSLRVGSTPANAGALRLTNNTGVLERNFGNTADITLIAANTANDIQIAQSGGAIGSITIGQTSSSGAVTINSTTGVNLTYGSTTRLATTSSGVTVSGALVTGNIDGSGTLELGGTPSTTGTIRLPNAGTVSWRNVSNGADISAMVVDASDNVIVGSTQANETTLLAANTTTIKVSSTTRIQANGTGIGFFATTPAAKQTVTGSRGGNAALASLLTALATYGLVTDSSS